MQRRHRLRSRADFARAFQSGKAWPSRLLVVRAYPNGTRTTRVGFAVTRRLGTAVARNRVKRRLRHATRELPFGEGWDVVIVARPAAASAAYHELREAIRLAMARAGLDAPPPEEAPQCTDPAGQ